MRPRGWDLLAEEDVIYQELDGANLRGLSTVNLQMRSDEWTGMTETIYRKAKISQAK
jgi:hypothetical protein